jgi:bifunctional UDP-N-acetylglucosamine pyrophosphorylase/glucosamine-1-phosphate N-acetyltransferase
MSRQSLACIILAAGKGQRMQSDLPKPLHLVAGRSMLAHVIAAAESLSPDQIVVVTAPDMPQVAAAAAPHKTAVQPAQNGTGGAVLAARAALSGFSGDILVLFGDAPLLTLESLRRLVDTRRAVPAVGAVFAGFRTPDPKRYGRMVLADDGSLARIVEYKDATEAERAITLCNGGIVCADGERLFDWLDQIGNDNAQGEYYLTDLAAVARRDNRIVQVAEVPAAEMEGANTRVELAALERLMQDRLRERHMLAGATLIDPASVFFSWDTAVGRDVMIEPNVFFAPGCRVADGAVIHAYSHLEGAHVGEGAYVGPFARLRPGSKIGPAAKVGNFVETKNTTLGPGAKASHLTYLGDAEIGARANVGAGVITCNYDGYGKHKTVIGDESFVGSNSALIAPVSIGHGAYVGAGSAIYEDVAPNALSLTRAPQLHKDGWATEFRRRKMKEKATKE